MSQKLKIVFSKNKKRVLVTAGNNDYGHFTLIEKAIQQVYELYNESYIPQKEVEIGVSRLLNEFIFKTKFEGSLSVLFYVSNMFPFLKLRPLLDNPEELIFLGYYEPKHKYCFCSLAEDKHPDQLSEHFKFKYEAFKFLNFLREHELVDEKRFMEIEHAIKTSTLYGGSRIAIMS